MFAIYPCQHCDLFMTSEEIVKNCPKCGRPNMTQEQMERVDRWLGKYSIETETITVDKPKNCLGNWTVEVIPKEKPAMDRITRMGEIAMWTLSILIMLLSMLLTVGGCGPTPTPPDKPPVEPEPKPPGYQDPVLQDLYQLHNWTRSAYEVPSAEITISAQLTRAAHQHANWMARNEKMSHTGDGGSSFWDRVRAAGYRGRGGGENIAAGYKTADAVMQGWMRSPGHERNILNRNWEHIGLGYAKSPKGRIYWCAVFAYGGSDSPARALAKPTREELPPPLENKGPAKSE